MIPEESFNQIVNKSENLMRILAEDIEMMS